MPVASPTALTVIPITSLYPTALDALTWEAADDTNGNSYHSTGRELLLARNTDETETYSLTIYGVADPYGRTVDIEHDIDAGDEVVAMLGVVGWQQADRTVLMMAEDAAIEIAIVRLPSGG